MPAQFDEVIGAEILPPVDWPLSPGQLDSLWVLFSAIGDYWGLPGTAPTLKTQWLDLLDATHAEYSGEYANAAAVAEELQTLPDWPVLLFRQTILLQSTDVSTRLHHAKFHVVNPFLSAFILLGGFRHFGGRNYRGYMGGSRSADAPPVRVGGRR